MLPHRLKQSCHQTSATYGCILLYFVGLQHWTETVRQQAAMVCYWFGVGGVYYYCLICFVWLSLFYYSNKTTAMGSVHTVIVFDNGCGSSQTIHRTLLCQDRMYEEGCVHLNSMYRRQNNAIVVDRWWWFMWSKEPRKLTSCAGDFRI